MSARREEIVDIARDLFAGKGYAATSMRDIADASSLLVGSLYSHFRSKAEIVELIVTPFYARLIPAQREAVEAGGTGAEQLERMVRRVLQLCAQHNAEVAILHYDWPQLSQMEDLGAVMARSQETLDLWLAVLTAGVADGSLRASIDAETAMRVITSAIHSVVDRQRYGAREDLVGSSGVEALVDDVVRTFVAGLGNRGSAKPGSKPALGERA
ncbi:MAG TPA: TetR/AcrR family transcriptional regulator [Acidimicrobiales bacterium]|nr:TetR/AcrR family transcriptional regulator [Acidimicrobiales bacterium]